jgi:MoxR-like ATPase
LVVGSPGTAKSEAVRRVAQVLGGRYFEYLLGRFTEPSEIFGPVDLRRLREGVVETQTEGMLPDAEIAFLDEVFLGSTAILNTLLGLLNERRFRRGHTSLEVPLRVCVGATNALPDDDTLAAFADRFLVRFFVEPLPDHQLEALLEGGWSLAPPKSAPLGIETIDRLAERARRADPSAVRPALAHALRVLKKNGVVLTDRRVVKTQRLIAAAAALADRDTPTEADLWPVLYVVPTQAGQRIARESLRDLLDRSKNELLAHVTADASFGPAARAGRLVALAKEALDKKPEGDPAAWHLRLEGLAREMDTGFASSARPPELDEVRSRIVAIVGGVESVRIEV